MTVQTSWDARPGKKPPRKKAVPRAETVAELNRKAWRDRHPQRAAEERALRVERAQLLKRWDHKRDGTPETHEQASRTQQGALARLHLSGAISADQLAWSAEIAAAAEAIERDVAVRTSSLYSRVDRSAHGDGSFFEALGAVRREVAYGRWRGQLGGFAEPVLAMIVDDIGVKAVSRQFRIGERRARKLLSDALDLWPECIGGAVREVDAATLAAAQAAIL